MNDSIAIQALRRDDDSTDPGAMPIWAVVHSEACIGPARTSAVAMQEQANDMVRRLVLNGRLSQKEYVRVVLRTTAGSTFSTLRAPVLTYAELEDEVLQQVADFRPNGRRNSKRGDHLLRQFDRLLADAKANPPGRHAVDRMFSLIADLEEIRSEE